MRCPPAEGEWSIPLASEQRYFVVIGLIYALPAGWGRVKYILSQRATLTGREGIKKKKKKKLLSGIAIYFSCLERISESSLSSR